MASRYRYFGSRESCSYLPDRASRIEYEESPDLSAAEYSERLITGWRRFGTSVFRPQCDACRACRSLRVDVSRFTADRSQTRVRRRNEGSIQLSIGPPRLTRAKLDLYDRYHTFQAATRGWEEHAGGDPFSYATSFIFNPIDTEEWCYTLEGDLVGVGYVDVLNIGLSAIYFIHDPDHRDRSLGTYNILRLIDECRARGLPHLYLGYFVEGCRSLEYKARFRPNEALAEDGTWAAFRP